VSALLSIEFVIDAPYHFIVGDNVGVVTVE